METVNDIIKSYLKVTRLITQEFCGSFGKTTLTYPQAMVLTVLSIEGPMRISKLAETVGSANSTISGVVDRLERIDLVQRDRSSDDHRVIYVSVTDKFRKLQSSKGTAIKELTEVIHSQMTPEESQTILKGLELLAEALETQLKLKTKRDAEASADKEES